jgi:uncharacterized protein (TIGR02217 family)
MSFLETPRFPDCVSFGALSKPRYKTNIVALASGYKSRNIEWAQALHSFDFGHNAFLPDDHEVLLHFFHALQGSGHQFRVKDHSDFETTAANGVLIPLHGTASDSPVGTVGLGYGAKVYLAAKVYTSGALTTVRWLQKLVTGSVAITRGGSPVTVGVSAGNIAIDTTTGKITFVADQSRTQTGASVPGATHEITFGSAFSPNFTVGQRIFLTSTTGTAATLLNDKSHEITYVSGATIRINTNTTGLTASATVGSMYPQASEALKIVCEFDVPCVLTDEASFEIIEKSRGEYVYRWTGIDIQEDRIAL